MNRRYWLQVGGALMMAAMTAQADLVHDYRLDSGLADQLLGPPLVSLGGSLSARGYDFGADQGLRLTGAFADPGNYSIELSFQFAAIDGWRRILDFKDRAADEGLYVYNSALQFVIIAGSVFADGPAGGFAADLDVNLILTRDGGTREVRGYLNGVPQAGFTFTDTTDQALFAGAGGIANFFIDDTVYANESSAGRVSAIRIYDSPLTATQAACLNGGTPQSCGVANAPEPATLALLVLGLAGLAGGYGLSISRRPVELGRERG